MAGRLLLPLADDVLHLLAHRVERDAEGFERLGGDSLTLVDQAQQDVLRADVVVIEHLGLFLGQDDDAPRAIGKSLEHAVTPYRTRRGGLRYVDCSQRSPRCGGLFALGVQGARKKSVQLAEPAGHDTFAAAGESAPR